MKKTKFIKLCICTSILVIAVAFIVHKSYILPASSHSITNKTIIIDAGHGFPDSGTSSQSGIKESDINLKIASKLRKLLVKNKVKVILTRNDDNSLSKSKSNNKQDDLNKRVEIRDNSNADAFISIHLNHFGEPKYYGAQVFYNAYTPESDILANKLQEKLIDIADPSNTRNIKASNDIYILKNSKIPSVLVECGFLSNPEEAKKLNSEEYQQKLAWAIYCGIIDYFEMDS